MPVNIACAGNRLEGWVNSKRSCLLAAFTSHTQFVQLRSSSASKVKEHTQQWGSHSGRMAAARA